MQHIDRRVRRTKQSLEAALIALTLEKEYEAITIQEITTRADVGYRTFFRHYADKEALLKDVLSTTIQELRQLMMPSAPQVLSDPGVGIAARSDSTILFQHVQENRDLYRVLLRSERSFIEALIAFTAREIETSLRPLAPPDIPMELVANHIASATFALVRWWLENDLAYPPQVMGAYLERLIARPTRALFPGDA